MLFFCGVLNNNLEEYLIHSFDSFEHSSVFLIQSYLMASEDLEYVG